MAARPTALPSVLRRVQRLAWFLLIASAVVVATSATCGLGSLSQVDTDIALLVIVISIWTIMLRVGSYVRDEQDRLASRERSARQQTMQAMLRIAKDRVNNKLAIAAGYSEFVANDPRLPPDLHESAVKALDGAYAAARAVDDLVDVRLLERASSAALSGDGASASPAK